MTPQFSEVITTEAQLRDVIGSPNPRVLRKQIAQIRPAVEELKLVIE